MKHEYTEFIIAATTFQFFPVRNDNYLMEVNILTYPLQTSLMKLRECWQMECIDLPEEFSLFYTSTPDQVNNVYMQSNSYFTYTEAYTVLTLG